ncbi:hypothetical protein EVA_16759 [gut metagenome]|uniref:Uncharacterized protein n=1 Tax=gut metagenome TaxID=749906 RepID=J9C5M8_9ZZZZ
MLPTLLLIIIPAASRKICGLTTAADAKLLIFRLLMSVTKHVL